MVREFGKRNVEEDHDPDEPMEDPGSRKRRRKDVSEIDQRFESLIQRVGEKSSSSLESNIEGLVAVLEADLTARKDRILNILLGCGTQLPEKMQIYASIVGLLNAKEHEFGSAFLEAAVARLKAQLRAGDWEAAHVSVLFLAELANAAVVSAHSLCTFLASLLEVITETSSPSVRRDWFARVVLHALAVSGVTLHRLGKTGELGELCDVAASYISTRPKAHVPLIRVWAAEAPHPQLDSLDTLWEQVAKVRDGGWTEPGCVRLASSFSAAFADALQHHIPTPFTPPPHQTGISAYPLPSVTFRMFHHTDCPEEGPGLPGSDSIDRFLVETDLEWIIRQHHLERKVCAEALLAYAGRRPVPLNYAILEVVFGQLLRLPSPPHIPIFYGSLLIELCKLQPDSMPQALAQTAELFYDRLDSIQPAAFDRLVDWFAYHLSNFHFRWSWDDWADALDADALAPKQLFVREVLHKSMRLSYHQHIVDLLPKSFAPLIPPKPAPELKFSREDAASLPGTALAHQLAQSIRSKASADDILALLKEADAGDAIEAFTLTLLHLGSKSFSHSFAALAKYHAVLKGLTEGSEPAQQAVLAALYDLWRTHPHMILVLVDKMLKMQIVECGVVVEWLFSPQLQEDFLRLWVWEVLESALLKLSRHVGRLRFDTEKAEEDWEAKRKQAAKENEDESAEGTIEDAESESSELRELREQLEGAESVQRNLLLTLFQKLTILLTEHLVRSESEGVELDTPWYRWLTGRLRQMFLAQWVEVGRYSDTLSSLLFTPDIDPHILDIFHQFQALRA